MKQILKKTSYQFLTVITFVIVLSLLLSSFTENKTKRLTFISNDLRYIEKQIVDWGKLGYEIEAIVPQSISETVTFDSRYACMNSCYKQTKGNVLLILKK